MLRCFVMGSQSVLSPPSNHELYVPQLFCLPLLQAQVADIGLMGGPAKMDGKAVEGVRIFLGGSIGEGPALANEFEKGIPCEESVLIPKLKEICVSKFGARER